MLSKLAYLCKISNQKLRRIMQAVLPFHSVVGLGREFSFVRLS